MKKPIVYIMLLLSSLSAQAQIMDSLDLKIGQMLITGVPSTNLTMYDPIIGEIKAGKVGGILLFEKNIDKVDSYVKLKQLTSALQHAASIPLWIAIDQEGGTVNRLKEKYGFPRSVTAEYLGKTHSLDSTRFYAEITASTLAGLGFNVNFAPVVDLSTYKENPIIAKYGRAYTDDPDSVAMHAAVVVEVHHQFGILSVLKHFPGHGSSHADTHLGIADVTPYWQSKELTPYQKLIGGNQIDAIMTAHIVNKRLDKKGLPGTLSKPIITGLLRDSLHFNGVVFSDDMQMHAISKEYGLEKSIKLAIQAGVDVLMFSNNIQNSKTRTVDTVHAIIKKLVASGELTETRIDASYQRIMQLKNTLPHGNL